MTLFNIHYSLPCYVIYFSSHILPHLNMQVRCKEVRRADQMHLPLKNCNATDESTRDSAAGIHYSVEVKDAYLPPWIISCICNAMGSDGTSFEARY